MKTKCLTAVFILSVLPVIADKSYACPPNQGPVAILKVYPKTQDVGQPVTFDATDSYDPDGYIQKCCWFWNWYSQSNHYEDPTDKMYQHTYQTAGEYRVRLWVKDNSGASDNDYYEWVKILPPPPVENLLKPQDGSGCQPIDNVRLEWESVSCADSYKVYLSDVNDTPTEDDCIAEPNDNYYNKGNLQPNTIYHWRVKTVDNGYTSDYSSVASFTTGPGQAAGPEPNGVTGVPIDVSLIWTVGGGAESQDIFLGTDFNDVNDAVRTSAEFRDNIIADINFYDTRSVNAFLSTGNKIDNIGSLGRNYDFGLSTTTRAEAFAINESGRIVGVSKDPNSNLHAFINIPESGSEPNWTSKLTDLHAFGDVNESIAYDISDANRIVGNAGDKAFYLKYPGDMNELPSLYSETSSDSVARAVTDGIDGLGSAAVGWSGGHAVLWDDLDSNNPSIYDLGTVEKYCMSRAYNINKYRHVVGYYWPMYGDDVKDRAFAGDIENGLTGIGTLEQGNISRAYGINNSGQIVGEATIDPNDSELRAFVYDDCQMYNLNELIESGPNDPCYIIASAQSINDDGFIVGYGKILDSNDPDSGMNRAILLIPIRPLAFWEFDETYGSTAPDSSVRGNHGQVEGASWTTGKIRGALRFDGQDDYVTTENMVLDPCTCDFTVAVWINLDTNDVNQVLVSQSNGVGTQWLQISNNGKLSTELGGIVDSNGTALSIETWHHIALTKSSDKVNFYLDGNLDGDADQTIGEIDSAAGNMVFGSNKTHDGDFFGGIMDDLRIYPWALSQNKILELFEDRFQN